MEEKRTPCLVELREVDGILTELGRMLGSSSAVKNWRILVKDSTDAIRYISGCGWSKFSI